jgi:aryl-alcohol dehydrogenase-like predicted oxidoreductase
MAQSPAKNRERIKARMRNVPLGNTGVEVSAFGLGTMYFGWRTDEATSYELLNHYVDAGGTFLDTANIYGYEDGQRTGAISELLLGRWMRERSNRSQLFVATKLGFEYADVERGLRAQQIEAECEKSLQRLGVETIDLYYAHVDDRNTPIEETLEAFDRLVRAGKVRFIGASNFLSWRLEEARWMSRTHGWAEYCCIQQRYSYLSPKPGANFGNQIAVSDELLDYCRTRGISLIAYSPLLSGVYSRADRPMREQYLGPDNEARLATLRMVAEEHGATPNQIVLAWMAQSDPIVTPLVAASSMAQLRENLGALDITLSPEQQERLNAA